MPVVCLLAPAALGNGVDEEDEEDGPGSDERIGVSFGVFEGLGLGLDLVCIQGAFLVCEGMGSCKGVSCHVLDPEADILKCGGWNEKLVGLGY